MLLTPNLVLDLQVVTTYEAYQNALGIRCVSMHRPGNGPVPFGSDSNSTPGTLMAIGSFDNKVRLISTRSWEMVLTLESVHPTVLTADQVLVPDDPKVTAADFAMTVEVIGAPVGLDDSEKGTWCIIDNYGVGVVSAM